MLHWILALIIISYIKFHIQQMRPAFPSSLEMSFYMSRASCLSQDSHLEMKPLTQALGLHPQLGRWNKETWLHSFYAYSCFPVSGSHYFNCTWPETLISPPASCPLHFFVSVVTTVLSSFIQFARAFSYISSNGKHCFLRFRMRNQVLVKLKPCLSWAC